MAGRHRSKPRLEHRAKKWELVFGAML